MVSYFLDRIFNLLLHCKWSLGKEAYAPSRIRRILVVRNDNIGDVLCSTPAIRSLRRAFPGAYMAALVVRYSQDAITGNPDLDQVFVYEKAKHRPDRSLLFSLFKQYQVLRNLKKKKFDLAIGMRSAFSWSEAWLVYFTGAPFRVGYSPVKRIDRYYHFFYNIAVSPEFSKGHEVNKVLRLIKEIGVACWDERLIVQIPEKEKEEVTTFFQKNEIDSERAIGFHLSCRRASSRWPAQKWADLAGLLVRDRDYVILTWGAGDEDLAEEVLSRVGEGVFLFSTPTLKQLGALQERCGVFLCPDGGTMHFSTAVGTPTIALFGEENPSGWGPWGKGHVVFKKGNHAELIPVDEVYRAIQQIIRKNKKERA
jgi:ADP-heptose:LPS heptosyltransferase